jgi:endogenous inhibitor of DNA gyrase (YacG/DUF329 family)
MNDLGAWVTEQYRIPGTSTDPDASDGDDDEGDAG